MSSRCRVVVVVLMFLSVHRKRNKERRSTYVRLILMSTADQYEGLQEELDKRREECLQASYYSQLFNDVLERVKSSLRCGTYVPYST